MLDILVLIGDAPSKKEGGTYFKPLNDILENKFRGLKYSVKHVVPGYLPKITKWDIYDNLQELMNYIELEHPKVIIAMGRESFMALGLPSNKVTEICNIPQKGAHLGGKDKLSYRKAGKFLPPVTLCTHSDIWVMPSHSIKNTLTYINGYKGHNFIERVCDRTKEILNAYPNWNKFSEEDFLQKITLHKDSQQAIKTLEEWTSHTTFAFDIETAGYEIPKEAQLNPMHKDAKITCIAIGDEHHVDVYNTYKFPELIPYIKKCMENKGRHLSWNGKFDIGFMETLWKVNFTGHTHVDGIACLYLTDMNLQFLGRGSSTLKFASSNFLPDGARYAGYQKNEGLDVAIKEGNGAFIAAHEDQFMLYCGIDVLVTFLTIKLMWARLSEKSRALVTQYYTDLTDMLNHIHKGGIKVDVPKMDLYINKLDEFTKNMEVIAREKWGVDNLKSNPEIARIVFEVRKLPKYYTDAGNPSVSVEALESFPDDDFCKFVLDYRGFLKQKEIFVAIKDCVSGGYCYPRYNPYRTTSGRLTACDPPIQIVPKHKIIITKKDKITAITRPLWINNQINEKTGDLEELSPNFKEIFIPDTHYHLVYSDYSQLEVVILACYIDKCSKDQTLQTGLREGRDIHSYTASLLYSMLTGTTYTEEFIKKHKKEAPYEGWRQDCKAVLFKLIYGGSYKSLAEDKNISEEDAKKIWDSFLDVIPGIKDYMKNQASFMAKNKFVEAFQGHTRELGICKFEPRNPKAKHIALNHPIQSTASFIVNIAMLELYRQLPLKFDKNSRILLTVHDSIATQFPDDRWLEGAKLQYWCKVNYVMEKFKEILTVPLKLEMFHGINWNDVVEVDTKEFSGKTL